MPAFTGTVVEKQSANMNPVVKADASASEQTVINTVIQKDSVEPSAKHVELSTGNKPVSRFKARKQNKVES